MGNISKEAIIGENCNISINAKIHSNVKIGNNVRIEDNVIFGYDNLSRIRDETKISPRLEIGDNCTIRAGAIIYLGSKIGNNSTVGHGVVLREGMSIGSFTHIGNGVYSEGYTEIGDRCVIHAQSHLTSFMTIHDYVFFGPGVVTMNDPAAAHYRDFIEREIKGPTIKNGVRIGGNASICPGVIIEENAFIGANACVTKNVPARTLWAGSPAKLVKEINASDDFVPAMYLG